MKKEETRKIFLQYSTTNYQSMELREWTKTIKAKGYNSTVVGIWWMCIL